MLPAAPSTTVALFGLRFCRLLGRPRTGVVSGSIENRHPTPRTAPAGIRRKLAHRLYLALNHRIWRRVDRIARGTQAAQNLYPTRLPAAQSTQQNLVWALLAPVTIEVGHVPFLGAFADRKGFSLLTKAWPLVAEAVPHATLQLIGRGELPDLAEQVATEDPRVKFLVDPPRQLTKDEVARSPQLAVATIDALRRPVPGVPDPLPAQDGRLSADAWMFP